MALQLKAMDFEQGEAALKPEPSSGGGALPGQLKAGLESMSGMDMSEVEVHRNSSKPQAVGGLAYAQGVTSTSDPDRTNTCRTRPGTSCSRNRAASRQT